MEWLGIIVFALTLGAAGILALTGGLTSPWLLLQPIFVVGGLVFTVLYIIIGDNWMAWTAAGLALIGCIIVLLGTELLVSDEVRTASAGAAAEELAAFLAGVVAPLMATLTFIMVLAAVGVTTVS
jgi:hypothetical protein